MKTCKTCGEHKAAAEYRPRWGAGDLSPHCMECEGEDPRRAHMRRIARISATTRSESPLCSSMQRIARL